MTRHNCDLCGSIYSQPILVAAPYVGDHEPPHVCQECGFVYVRERRTSEEIAKDWDTIWGEGYSSKWPMVQARLAYVAEWYAQEVGSWAGKRVLDVGAGEGDFIRMILGRKIMQIEAIEPHQANVDKLNEHGQVLAYAGTIQGFTNQGNRKFDIVTILWTLENCGDCIEMLKLAKQCCKPDGRVVVATGSRILVPYKKPVSHYFSSHAQDLHSFRFSRNSLAMAMMKAGLNPVKENRWLDGDWLVMAATPQPENVLSTEQDDPAEVMKFFESWAREWP